MKKLLTTVLTIIVCVSLHSQSNYLAWGSLGIGSFTGKKSGIAFNFDLNYLKNSSLFTLRYINNTEFILFTSPPEQLDDVGLLYGKVLRNKNFSIHASVGIGVVSYLKRTSLSSTNSAGLINSYKYNTDREFSVGIPLELQTNLITLKYIGLGIKIYSNINFINCVVGGLLTLQIGCLR